MRKEQGKNPVALPSPRTARAGRRGRMPAPGLTASETTPVAKRRDLPALALVAAGVLLGLAALATVTSLAWKSEPPVALRPRPALATTLETHPEPVLASIAAQARTVVEDARAATRATDPTAAYFAAPQVLLRGRVIGCSSDPREASVSASVYRRIVSGRPHADGHFELDVTRLFFDGMNPLAAEELVLAAAHPENEPGETRFRPRLDGLPLELDEEQERPVVVLGAEVTLLPAAWILGAARTVDGTREGIAVSVFAMRGGVPAQLLWGTTTNRQGLFRARVPPGRPALVVACAAGFLPECRRAEVAGTEDLGELVLTRGVRITGHVRLGPGLPAAGARITAFRWGSGEPRAMGGYGTMGWDGSAFATRCTTTTAAADGSFAFGGLSPGEYDLRIGTVPGASMRVNTGLVVAAPASGVELGGSMSLAHIVLAGSEPRESVELQLRGASPQALGNYGVDREGRLSIWLLGGATYSLSVRGRQFELTTPAGGGESTYLFWL